MFSRGYINSVALAGQQLELKHAAVELDTVKRRLEVLENFTKQKMLHSLDAAISAAEARLARTRDKTIVETGGAGTPTQRSTQRAPEQVRIVSELEQKLLRLEVQKAKLEVQVARAALQDHLTVNESSPGAIPETVLDRARMEIDLKDLALQRAEILLELHQKQAVSRQ